MNEHVRRMVEARNRAIDVDDDKALGREIYHQLVEMGYQPHDIDARNDNMKTSAEEAAERDRDVEAKTPAKRTKKPAETTQAPEAPEAAVLPAPERP